MALALHTFATFGTAFQFKCSQEPRNQFRGLPNHSRSFPSHSQFSVRSQQGREPPLPPLDHPHAQPPPTRCVMKGGWGGVMCPGVGVVGEGGGRLQAKKGLVLAAKVRQGVLNVLNQARIL